MTNYSKYNETESSLSDWLKLIKKERLTLFKKILPHIKPNSIAIEIGSGSSWLSSLLSNNKNITHITAIDIDNRKLDLAKHYFSKKLNADMKKIIISCIRFS